MLKDELEIIIITYNRKNKLKKTLQTLITENSPIKDFNITILDNASDDGTNELCEAFCKEYTNFKYIRNKYNIGISGNTIRAFELASKKWLWILCDDDKYDWSGWAEIEDALKRDYDIVHTTYTDGVRNETTPYKLNEEIFLPTAIYNTRNIDSTFFQNAYGIAYTLCPSHALNCKII
ncbi:MAG TPA: glycosyltransferase family 2 protein, partial [Candidatus Stercorousia faecigallinarum]|nr:glycosyltransferase family 2 protein [Candidatus Stercorousia faecigallinarum]